jgi:hypothetical protein
METEFINVYIETLTKNLHDLVSKNVMLEARLNIADKVVTDLNIKLQKAESDLDKLQAKKQKAQLAQEATF